MHKYLLHNLATALAIASTAMQATAADNLVLRGLVTDAESWTTTGAQRGIYYIPMSADEEFRPVAVSNENWIAPYTGHEVEGIYYSHDAIDNDNGSKEYFINQYNLYTEENIGRIPSGGYTPILLSDYNGSIAALLLNESTGKLGLGWVYYYTSGIQYRSSYDVNDEYSALYYDGRDFYMIQNIVENGTVTGSNWGRYNTRRKSLEVIGATGVAPLTDGCIARHPDTSELYWSVNGSLYNLNKSTGKATEIVAWPDKQQVVSLEFVEETNPKAPHPAENLGAVFDNGSLSGKITFTAPASNLNGTHNGHLDYTVTDASTGEVLATGTCGYGDEVEAHATVPADGFYEIGVTMANGSNQSAIVTRRFYIGKDSPSSPSIQKFEIADNIAKLQWAPTTKSLNGGYIDTEAITYSVVRYPDGQTVADHISATTLTDTIPEPDNLTLIYYGVTAHYDRFNSPQRTSSKIAVGTLVPPYHNNFPDSEALAGFTCISGNQAAYKWESNFSGGVCVTGESDKPMDQWLITPPVKLESGYNYLIKLTGYTNGNRTETLSIAYGDSPTIDAMTNVVKSAELTAYNSYYPDEVQTFLSPAKSGYYHIAIHGNSPEGYGRIYISDLSIELGISDNAPGQSTDIKVQRDLSGKLLATVSFVAPTQTYSGAQLTDITGITVRLDDKIVKEFGPTQPGAAMQFVDTLSTAGNHIYRIQAFNSAGSGYITSSEPSFVGTGKPSYPPSVKAVETTDGNVTITWEAITTDADGNTIDPDNVLYEIRDNNNALAYRHAGTSLTYDYGEDATQRFMMFRVRGITDGGTGPFNSCIIPVGRPLDGFTESFPGGEYSTHPEPSVIQQTILDDAQWKLSHDNIGFFPSQDGDQGFVVMVGKNEQASSALTSPKINLADMTNPGISIWVRGIDNGQDTNLNEIYIDACEVGTDTWTEVTGNVIGNFTVNGKWSQFGTSLDDFAGKIVQIRIRGIVVNYSMIGIDNIVVGSMTGNDLEIKGISAQAAVIPGKDFNIEVTVKNNAIYSSGAYKAVLYADGKQTASVDCNSLDPFQETVVTFQSTLDSDINVNPVQYHAVIINTGDENTANNTSDRITVHPLVNRRPRVTDLSATSVNNTVTLTWSTPDITGATVSEHVAESFEAAESFSTTVDGWTFVDLDDKPIGSINSLQLPGFTGENVKASFFVMDASDDYPANKKAMPALTGDKYIASIYAADNSAVDDWAISPELSGYAQIISFSARSANASYPETIDVMYSTGGTDPAEFTSLPAMTDIIVPSKWTRYNAGIPEGAKHFAIRSHATNSFMLAIDDIEFESAHSHALEAPIGYNVFRDTQLLPDTDISGTTFTDTEVDTGMHSYYITAIYDDGESDISNTASIFTTGINGTEVSEIRIASANGIMTISGAMNIPVMVSTIDGRVIFNATADSDSLRIPVAPGIYAVTAGGRSAKIAVR